MNTNQYQSLQINSGTGEPMKVGDKRATESKMWKEFHSHFS